MACGLGFSASAPCSGSPGLVQGTGQRGLSRLCQTGGSKSKSAFGIDRHARIKPGLLLANRRFQASRGETHMQYKLGCNLSYRVESETLFIFNVEVAELVRHKELRETLSITPDLPWRRYTVPDAKNRYTGVLNHVQFESDNSCGLGWAGSVPM